jgi:hypothetical protein
MAIGIGWRGMAVVVGLLVAVQAGAEGGARRDGDRFVNAAGPRPRAPVQAMVPFLGR